jgi:hypothetical protein
VQKNKKIFLYKRAYKNNLIPISFFAEKELTKMAKKKKAAKKKRA